MDFEVKFSPEIEAFRSEVATWMDANLPELIYSSNIPDYNDKEDQRKREQVREALGHKGWLYPTFTPKYGGGGLSMEQAVIIHQELEKRHVESLSGLGGRMLAACGLAFGTEEQKQRFVAPIMRGEADSWMLLTEPQGGSDLASAKTTAILDGDDYIVNGQKIFVGNQHTPEYGFAIVNSHPNGARHRNLSYLVIPMDAPGVTVQPLYLLAHTSTESHKCIVFFDDVRVPVSNRIGEHNEGWKVASVNMELEHGGAGNISHDRELALLIDTLHTLPYDGKPLIEDADARDTMAEVLTMREINRLFGLRNFWLNQNRIRAQHESPQQGYWTKTRAHPFVQKVQDLLGNYALQRDPQYMVADGFLELAQRQVFVTVHAGGGLNIRATIVARRLGVGRNVREEAPEVV